MHLEMLIVLITTLAVAQIVLIQWKQRHFRSYQLVTTLGEFCKASDEDFFDYTISYIVNLIFLILSFRNVGDSRLLLPQILVDAILDYLDRLFK